MTKLAITLSIVYLLLMAYGCFDIIILMLKKTYVEKHKLANMLKIKIFIFLANMFSVMVAFLDPEVSIIYTILHNTMMVVANYYVYFSKDLGCIWWLTEDDRRRKNKNKNN